MCNGASRSRTAGGCGCGGRRADEPGTDASWPSAGRVFDEVVYRHADPNALLGAGDGEWEVLAEPGARPTWHEGRQALIIERALGEGRLGHAYVVRLDRDAARWIGPDGNVSDTALVLGRRQTPAAAPPQVVASAEPLDGDAEDAGQRRAGVFPPRDASAIGGRAFMARIAGEGAPPDWAAREEQIVQALTSGNMPDRLLRWIPITLTHGTGPTAITGTLQVLPDYLAVGSDTDFVHMPLDPISAQRVADHFKLLLPTARICHAIYEGTPARQRLNGIARDYYLPDAKRRSAARGRAQTSTAAYLEHSEAIQARMKAAGVTLGELVAGHKKDVILARRLHTTPDRIAFHGFYDDAGYPREPCYENAEGRPKPDCRKDNPTLAHSRRFSDYSQGVRLVHPWMTVNGERRLVADVLADPTLSALLSSEGPIVPPRIPALPAAGRTGGTAARAPAREDADEAIPRRGRGAFRHEPLGGEAGDNVELRWNVDDAIAAGTAVDIVVHLHGYGGAGAGFLARKAAAAGIDLVDASGAPRLERPTLAIVPLGRHVEGVQWVFDRVATRAALDALIDGSMAFLATAMKRSGGSPLPRGRLALHAHSGGGAGLSRLLENGVDPDEVLCFDSIYGGLEPIRQWAQAKIASPRAASGGLRVFYTGCSAPDPAHPAGQWVRGATGRWDYRAPGSWRYWASDRRWHLISTEVNSRRLAEAIAAPIRAGAPALAKRYRVERTSVAHGDIPSRYAPALMRDITVDVPGASTAPAATVRPICVANDDWLTAPLRKPGGDGAPPARPEAAS
jgi:hypothetical protein